MSAEQPHEALEHPATMVQGMLIVVSEASAQLASMPVDVRKVVLAALRDLRADPYGTFDSLRSPLRLVYHVAEHPGGLQGLMVLEDELYKMRYQVLADAGGTYAKVLEFPWWEKRTSQPEMQLRQPKTPHRNEGDYDFKFLANAIKEARRRIGGSIVVGLPRFIKLERRKRP